MIAERLQDINHAAASVRGSRAGVTLANARELVRQARTSRWTCSISTRAKEKVARSTGQGAGACSWASRPTAPPWARSGALALSCARRPTFEEFFRLPWRASAFESRHAAVPQAAHRPFPRRERRKTVPGGGRGKRTIPAGRRRGGPGGRPFVAAAVRTSHRPGADRPGGDGHRRNQDRRRFLRSRLPLPDRGLHPGSRGHAHDHAGPGTPAAGGDAAP